MSDGWDFINSLEDQYLKGGYILSEYVSEWVRTTDLAFIGGAYLATVVTSIAAIESYLRSEYTDSKSTLKILIDNAPLEVDLKVELHELRTYRNRWVHVDDPWNDDSLLDETRTANELEQIARRSLTALRQVIYEDPWV